MLSLATVCAYYTPLDLTTRYDPHADGLILEAVEPVMRQLDQDGELIGFSFMRLIEHGAHVQIGLTGPRGYLQDVAVPALRASLAGYFATHAALLAAPDYFAEPVAQVHRYRLRQNPPYARQVQAGTVLVDYAPMPATGPGCEYSSPEMLQAHLELQYELCRELFEVLALNTSIHERRLFIGQFINDLLRLAPLHDRDRYLLTERLKQSWIDFFEVRPDVLLFYRKIYTAQALDSQPLLAASQSLAGSLKALPERLHPAYVRMYRLLERMLPRLVETSRTCPADGYALLVRMYHQLHNRLSLGIEDEVCLTMMLEQFYYNRLLPADVEFIEETLNGAYATHQLL